MKRPAITQAMKLEVIMKLGRWDCYRCEKQFWLSEMQWDHVQALVDGGTHDARNLRPVCVGCHRDKSAFEHIRNSKSKRLAKAREAHEAILKGEVKKPEGKIKSRGFNKTLRKRMNGKVEKRL